MNKRITNNKFQQKKKFKLVLDLDETLIHTIKTNLNKTSQFENFHNLLMVFMMEQIDLYVYYRPYMIYFISKMYKFFDIIVVSNGEKEYVESVVTMINNMLPEHYISECYSRLEMKNISFKSLSVLNDVNKENVVIIDDNIEVWNNDIKNVIKIEKFLGPENKNYMEDDLLYNLTNIISDVINNSNVSNAYEIINEVSQCFF